MANPSLRRIERFNYILGIAVSIAGLLTQPVAVGLGLAVGAALTCLNFYALRKLVTKWTEDAAAGRPSGTMVLIIPKMIGLMAAVVLCLAVLPINPVAFVIGYSLFIPSIIVEVFTAAMRTTPPTNSTSTEHDHG